jgi:hypothetical protein
MTRFTPPTSRRDSTAAALRDVPLPLIVVGALLFLPVVAGIVVLIYLLTAFVGAPALLLLWNLGLVEFLSATGLGTVSTLGFWGAFKINLLFVWVGFALRSVGQGFKSPSTD